MAGGPHILVVDDNALARESMAELLREEGYQVSTAYDGVGALAAAEADPPALVISDVRMPRGDGFFLVRQLRAKAATARVPVLLISALAETNRRVAGLDLGADDFLAKPVDANELLARVRAQLRRVEEREALERRAAVDPLTGVPNRRGIGAVLAREEHEARRTGSPLAVLMVDVDRFKSLNDTHGHQAGDTVLRHLARSLVEAVRVTDHVGRLGGDEFLIVLPGCDAIAAASLAARLRNLELPLAVEGAPDLVVRVSIGVAILRPDDTLETMLDRADREMYRVKRTSEHPAIPEE